MISLAQRVLIVADDGTTLYELVLDNSYDDGRLHTL